MLGVSPDIAPWRRETRMNSWHDPELYYFLTLLTIFRNLRRSAARGGSRSRSGTSLVALLRFWDMQEARKNVPRVGMQGSNAFLRIRDR